MGSKGRFYKLILEEVKRSKAEKYVDLFAGSLEVAININKDLGLPVLANVKDEQIESFIKLSQEGKLIAVYEKITKQIFQNESKAASKKIYEADKEKGNRLKGNFSSIWNEVCPYCKSKVKNKESCNFTEDEQNIAKTMFGFGGRGTSSLSANFYSSDKANNLKQFSEALKNIEITTELFNENWKFENSFIILDPPYISKTKFQDDKFLGYDCCQQNGGVTWKLSDDEKLVQFIIDNLETNTIMVFGARGNNLEKLIIDRIPQAEITYRQYKSSTFGKVGLREEWHAIIDKNTLILEK